MEKTPYHHLPDGSFRNPEGSPERNSNFKWSFKVFNKEKKKLNMTVPEDHAIDKQRVLTDLENLKNDDYVGWIGHATFLIKLGNTTIITDTVFSKNAGPWLVKVANFVNDELVKLYDSEPFYNVTANSVMHELIGSLLICLSPHTSAGVLGRLIGFTSAKAQYGHPFFHAAKRRNCDGDEDSIMLLLDGLLNFSDSFVPTTRGGTMDIPRDLSTRIDPMEIDSEAHNVELNSEYPLEFYEHSE